MTAMGRERIHLLLRPVLEQTDLTEVPVSRREMLKPIVGLLLFCGLGVLSPTEARAQNPHDYALYKAIVAAQSKMAAAAKDGSDDALASIFRNSMLELFLYKNKYNISDGIAQNSCQRAYEELSTSAMFLSSYIRPSRKISGPVDRAEDGREADKWWDSHREALVECERLLKLPQSPAVGPDRLTSIVPR